MSKNPTHRDKTIPLIITVGLSGIFACLMGIFLTACNTTGWPMHEVWCCDDQPHEVVE